MAPYAIFANLPDGLQPFSLLDQALSFTGQLGIIPCTATGTNNLVLTPIASTFPPTITAYSNYMAFSFVAPSNSNSTVTVSIAGLPALVLYSQSGQTTTSVVNGTLYLILYDNRLNSSTGGFHVVGNPTSTRTQLTQNLQLFVSTTGSDTTGNGTSAFPWATLQFAYDYVVANIDMHGLSVNLNVGAGNFAGLIATAGPFIGNALMTITGAGSSSTFIQCTTNGEGFQVKDLAVLVISGLTIEDNAGATGAWGILCEQLGIIDIGTDIKFGTIANGVHIGSEDGGNINVTGGAYTITGHAIEHFNVGQYGRITLGATVVSIPSALAFTFFASAQYEGCLDLSGASFTGSGVAGTTGTKFINNYGGLIISQGVDINSILPGNVNGVYTFGPAGGFYDATNAATWSNAILATPAITGSAVIPGGTTPILTTAAGVTSGAASGTGTLTNAPVSGNPTKWIPFDDNGTTRYIPAW